ncbi:MAG: hypothetical protein HY913_02010 [Desulfomonile tiedjei]|nr:hypothetical protein [Desulfomonile tiedjei]
MSWYRGGIAAGTAAPERNGRKQAIKTDQNTQSCLEIKQSLLKAACEAYEEVIKPFPAACRKDCKACCTQNVLGTTLEADLLVSELETKGRKDLLEKIRNVEKEKRLQPNFTINSLAGYCLRREEPPWQHREFDSRACPLREEAGCAIYQARPFGCRCLWSEEICEMGGEALMSPVLISLNGMFQQILEHIDAGGLYGNMIDLVCAVVEPGTRSSYRSGVWLNPTDVLHAACPNPGFLVPREHRPTITRALTLLWQKRVGDLSFREALELIRSE